MAVWKSTSAFTILALGCFAIGKPTGEGHDGDSNIFPGNAMAIGVLHNVAVESPMIGYLGDLVPPEDSDRIPRIHASFQFTKALPDNDPLHELIGQDIMALEFRVGGEHFRFTHARERVQSLHAGLQQLIRNNRADEAHDASLHITYYNGSVFRDGVHRVSGFVLLDGP